MIGILRLECPKGIKVKLLCHGAAGKRVREIHPLLRRENLARLRHKAHAAHDNILMAVLACLHAQTVGVTHIVGNLKNLMPLIGVCKDAEVLLFLQTEDFRLDLLYGHSFFNSSLPSMLSCSQGWSGARKPASASFSSISPNRSAEGASTR